MTETLNWVYSDKTPIEYESIDFLCEVECSDEFRFYWLCVLNTNIEPNSIIECKLIFDFQTPYDTSNWKVIRYAELNSL